MLIGDIYKRDSSDIIAEVIGLKATQYKWEFTELLNIVKGIKVNNIVEIGSDEGGSLYHFMQLVPSGGKIASVSLPYISRVLDYSKWNSWVPQGVDFKYIQGNSHLDVTKEELVSFMPSIDFLFIDGDHSYAGVKADFVMYSPLVREGGIVAFHDIQPHEGNNWCTVDKFWKDIKEAGYLTRELHSMPNQDERGIGVVFV